jgi:hypothetical protein
MFAAAATAADEKGDTHEGKIVMAGNGRVTMTDKDGKNEHTHEVAQDAKVSCDGKECRLEDLKKGYSVKVSTEKRGGKEVATRLEAKKSA